jgi:hypothetical protein
MRVSESLDMQGRLIIQKFNPEGQLLTEVKANNFIVYTGRDLVAKMFLNQKIEPVEYIAVGMGDKAVDPIGDTALQQEVFRKKIKLPNLAQDIVDTEEKSVPTEKGSIAQKNRKIRLSVDLDFDDPPNQPVDLREAGLFNSPEVGKGIMYNRVVFPIITKTQDFKLTLVWEIIF